MSNILNDPIIFLLMKAIAIVESGDTNDKVGSAGELGCMQITAICVKDINRIYDLEFEHEHAINYDYAKIMFFLYSEHYALKIEERERRPATLEDIARNWNGGHLGYRKECTELYWGKVQLVLEPLIENFNARNQIASL